MTSDPTLTAEESDKPIVSVEWCLDGHDGAGWYYWDDEYRDEGSVGAFATRDEAVADALEAGYREEANDG